MPCLRNSSSGAAAGNKFVCKEIDAGPGTTLGTGAGLCRTFPAPGGDARSRNAIEIGIVPRLDVENSQVQTLSDIPQMTSKFAVIIPPYHRQGNDIPFAAIG